MFVLFVHRGLTIINRKLRVHAPRGLMRTRSVRGNTEPGLPSAGGTREARVAGQQANSTWMSFTFPKCPEDSMKRNPGTDLRADCRGVKQGDNTGGWAEVQPEMTAGSPGRGQGTRQHEARTQRR